MSVPPRGLINLGNTCFINSCIQVLAQIRDFDDIFVTLNAYSSKRTVEPDYNTALLKRWEELRSAILFQGSSSGPINPMDFIRTVNTVAISRGKILFAGMNQNDMPEFLLFFIDCLHMGAIRPIEIEITGSGENGTDDLALQCFQRLKLLYEKEFSDFYPLLYGMCVSRIFGADKKTPISETVVDQHFILDVPIPAIEGRTLSLYDCLELFFDPEQLTDWKNEQTGTIESAAYKQLRFWNFPPVLVIAFKRFSNRQQKNASPIEFPHELDMSKYVVGYTPEKYKYSLFGVVNHMGSAHGGHYTAFVKNESGAWFHCNDASVSPVDSGAVITDAAYCLFYTIK